MKEKKKIKLPEGWKWVKLGDTSLVTIIMGQSPPGEFYNKDKTGLPFFQGCADFGKTYPSPTVWCSKPKKTAEPNDILLSVRAPVGPTNIADKKCCIGRGLAAIRCKEGLSWKYLKWILRKFEKQICAEGAGSIFGAIGGDEIKSIEFPLPPTLADQIRIASELEKKMEHIDKMRQAALRKKEALSAMMSAILRQVFPYKEGDNLPTGWKWAKLRDLSLKIQYGLSKSSSMDVTGPKLLRITDIQNGKVNWDCVPKCVCSPEEKASYKLEDGDIVFTRTGATTGKSFLVKNPENAVFASYLIRVQCNKSLVLPDFLNAFFQSPCYWNLIYKDARGGTLAGFNATMLSKMVIPFPVRIAEQERMCNELQSKAGEIHKMRLSAENELEAVEALPGAILRETFDFEDAQEGT